MPYDPALINTLALVKLQEINHSGEIDATILEIKKDTPVLRVKEAPGLSVKN